MELSEEQIIEFQCLWQQTTGQSIDRDAAKENAENLVRLVELLDRIGPS